jgi:hypothetical protein
MEDEAVGWDTVNCLAPHPPPLLLLLLLLLESSHGVS